MVDSLSIGQESGLRADFKPAESQLTSGVNQSGLGGTGFNQSGISQSVSGQSGLNTGAGYVQGSTQLGGGYGQGGAQIGGYQSGSMRSDYGSSAGQLRGDFTQVGTGGQIRGGQSYGGSSSMQGGQGGQGIQGIQGATLTTSAIKQGVSESGMTSPEAYKQFQSPSSTAMKLDESKYERSYDIGSSSASRYNTPGTREWKRE